jgi:ketosteroid isomerase-like protein
MKKTVIVLSSLLLLTGKQAFSQTDSKQLIKTVNTQTMTNSNNSTLPVKEFFSAFGNGNLQGILNTFADNCLIVAVRAGKREGQQIYGSYEGKEGLKQFLTNLMQTFDTKAFKVEHIIGKGNIVFANGLFTHQIKSTGKLFSSEWALKCVIKDGKIAEYHFFEDSAMFLLANTH